MNPTFLCFQKGKKKKGVPVTSLHFVTEGTTCRADSQFFQNYLQVDSLVHTSPELSNGI